MRGMAACLAMVVLLAGFDAGGEGAEGGGIEEPTGVVTLEEALGLAVMGNPSLAAYGWDIRIAEARALQASLRPNPELALEVEEVGGTGDLSGVEGAETTLELGQLIEVAGKRGKRTRVAELAGEVAGWDYEARRLELFVLVSEAYYEVLAAQERAELAGEQAELAEAVLAAVEERVEAGKDSPMETTRARVARATAEIAVRQAEARLRAARATLASTWGAREARFERAAGSIEGAAAVADFGELAGRLAEHPAMRRWESRRAYGQAAVELEKARAWPDPRVAGGYRYLNESDDSALVFGVSVPLPFFDRNQGEILAAKHELAKARAEQAAAEVGLHEGLARAYQELAAGQAEVEGLDGEVVPGARRAFEAAQEAYREGKVDYLQVLDAQRTYFEARAGRIEAWLGYRRAKAQVEGLVGGALERAIEEQTRGQGDGE